MPVSDLLRSGTAHLTTQQIADMMLSEDRARRAAHRRGDYHQARLHELEVARLGRELNP